MSFKIVCVFACLAVVAHGFPYEADFQVDDKEHDLSAIDKPHPRIGRSAVDFMADDKEHDLSAVIKESPRISKSIDELAVDDDFEDHLRFRRSPEKTEEQKKKEEQERLQFQLNLERSKKEGDRVQADAKWRAYESDKCRHQIDTYVGGYVRQGGENFRFNPNMRKDSDYKYGATYTYKCC